MEKNKERYIISFFLTFYILNSTFDIFTERILASKVPTCSVGGVSE